MSLRRYGGRVLSPLAHLREAAPGYRLVSADLASAVEAVVWLVEDTVAAGRPNAGSI